jgi:hypothetical protein
MTERIRYGIMQRRIELLTAIPALAGALVWTVAVYMHEEGSLASVPTLALLALPLVLAVLMMLWQRWPPGARLSLAWMGIFAAAVFFYSRSASTYVMLGVPALAISAFLARRFPASFLVGTLLASGFYGTAEAFVHVSFAQLADVLLAGLWLGTIWSYLLDDRRRRTAPMTGMTLLALYAVLTFFEIFLAPYGVSVGAQAFRGSAWYMMSFMLLAVAPLTRRTIQRATVGFLLVSVAVGGYATFRWIFGPSHQELLNSLAQTNNNMVDGHIRLFGSFVTGKELAAWTAAAIPFSLVCVLALRGRQRWLAAVACAVCAIAMFGADVRVALVGVVPAVALVFALFQASRGFPGARIGTTLGVFGLAAVIGVGSFAYTLGGKSDTAQRYKVLITHPTQDASYQARILKWNEALRDIAKHPLGQGLGTSGRTQQRYGPYLNISNQEIDNSYLEIALEQGAGVALFFIVGYAVLLVGIARRAVLARTPLEAALAIGAAAVLVEFGISLFTGTYIEGLTALATWMFVGLGISGITERTPQPEPKPNHRPSLPDPAGSLRELAVARSELRAR